MLNNLKEKTVQVLLSTFNGEKYLREQLDSYLALEGFENVRVLVRDDGSGDGTLAILDEYQERYGFSVLKGKNIGINASYSQLLHHADIECEYFALSDQDDVWLRQKFSRALKALDSLDSSKALLYASSTMITDANLTPLGKSVLPAKGVSFFNAMVQNVCSGHTQVFNRQLLQKLLTHGFSNAVYIDHWIYLVASGIGEVVFDDEVTVLHRQHGANAVGYEQNPVKNFQKRLMRLLKKAKQDPSTLQLKDFYSRFAERLPEPYRKELFRYFSSQKNLFMRIFYMFKTKIFRQTNIETLIFKFLYILNKYKCVDAK